MITVLWISIKTDTVADLGISVKADLVADLWISIKTFLVADLWISTSKTDILESNAGTAALTMLCCRNGMDELDPVRSVSGLCAFALLYERTLQQA